MWADIVLQGEPRPRKVCAAAGRCPGRRHFRVPVRVSLRSLSLFSSVSFALPISLSPPSFRLPLPLPLPLPPPPLFLSNLHWQRMRLGRPGPPSPFLVSGQPQEMAHSHLSPLSPPLSYNLLLSVSNSNESSRRTCACNGEAAGVRCSSLIS